MEDRKASFFAELDALNDSSDEEEDMNESRSQAFNEPYSQLSSSLSSSPLLLEISLSQKRVLVNPAKTIPTIHRTTSAPTPSMRIVTETPVPALQRKTSLLRHDISADVTPNTSFIADTPLQGPTPRGQPLLERRTVSTPTFGSVVMTNSKGIKNMLNSKPKPPAKEVKKPKKRKSDTIPEDKQVLKGQTFYYVPPNDIHPGRKLRIERVQAYGGIWTKEWNVSITHVVVDPSSNTFEEAMEFLKETIKVSYITPLAPL